MTAYDVDDIAEAVAVRERAYAAARDTLAAAQVAYRDAVAAANAVYHDARKGTA